MPQPGPSARLVKGYYSRQHPEHLPLEASDFVMLGISYILPAEETLVDFVNHREAKVHHTFWLSSLQKRKRELETGHLRSDEM